MLKATEVREIVVNGQRCWEVFTTPEEVLKELKSQGNYPEICLTIVIEEGLEADPLLAELWDNRRDAIYDKPKTPPAS